MANLRDMLDGKTLETIDAAASPLAGHISKHMQDPVGATKENFGKLTKAKLDYDQAREETQRGLAPVQSVINHLSQMHNLTPNQDQNMMPGMDPMQDPNNPDAQGQNQFQDEEGIPANMNQTVGKMNSNRPSLAGTQPGVAPGDGQTVRPPKLGQAQPGGPGARNAPSPQGNTYNKTAAKPKGAGKLPGANGPGSKKNVARNNKAQSGTTGRQIKVEVHGALDTMHAASYSNVESSFTLGALKSASPAIPVGTVRAGMGVPGAPAKLTNVRLTAKRKKKMKAGPAQLNDKVTDNSDDEVAYNPKLQAGGPGSGRRPSGRSYVNQTGWRNLAPKEKRSSDPKTARNNHIAKMKDKGYTLLRRGKFPNGTLTHEMRTPSGRTKYYQTFGDGTVTSQF